MTEKDPVLEALRNGHKNLRQVSNEIRDAAVAFRELTDAITALLIYTDGCILLSKKHREAVDRVRDALDKVQV